MILLTINHFVRLIASMSRVIGFLSSMTHSLKARTHWLIQ